MARNEIVALNELHKNSLEKNIVKPNKREEQDIANTLVNFGRIADLGHNNWMERAKENFRFYIGDQWKAEDKDYLEDFGRPAHTFNEVASIINVITGVERQNRMDETCYAKHNGLEELADQFTVLMKQANDDSNGAFEKSMAFFDGLIAGKGWIGLDVNYEEDPLNGDIEIKRENTFHMQEDPEAERYDLDKSARFIIKNMYWDIDTILAHYPDKEKQIFNFAVPDMHQNMPTEVVADYTTYYRGNEDPIGLQLGDIAPKEYKYKIREFWWKKLERRVILINVKNGEFRIAKKDKETLAKDLLKKLNILEPNDWIIKERPMKVLNCTTMMGHTILEHINDPFDGIQKYPFFRFVPYWVNGYCKSVMDDLKDPARQVNKAMSQVLHHLNLSANSGWIADEDAVEDFSVLEDFGSTPGIVIKKRRGRQLERIEPTNISQGHLGISGVASQKLKIISGINTDLLGHTPEKEESGRAMWMRHQQGLTTSEIIFDNYRYTLKMMAEALLEVIRFTNIYSESDVRQILGREKEKQLNYQLYKLRKLGKYGIKVSESPYSPTVKQANFRSLLEAAQSGVPIPPELIIELSDFPQKAKLMQMLQQQKNEQQKQELMQQILKNGGQVPSSQAQ